ncbi:astacin [Cooperia oncophora]
MLWSEGMNYYFHKLATKDRIMVFPEDDVGHTLENSGSGCKQYLSLRTEIGHALGFFHTMSDTDRDDFITVNKHNIKVDWLSQFIKKQRKQTIITTYVTTTAALCTTAELVHRSTKNQQWFRLTSIISRPLDLHSFLSSNSPMLNEALRLQSICNKSTSCKCENWADSLIHETAKMHMSWWLCGPRCNKKDTIALAVVTRRFRDIVTTGLSSQGNQIEVKLVNFTKGRYLFDGCPYAGVEIKQKGPKASLVTDSAHLTRLNSSTFLHKPCPK